MKQKELKIFDKPFNVEPADVPDKPPQEIIELQRESNELKAQYNSLLQIEFMSSLRRDIYCKFASVWVQRTAHCEYFWLIRRLVKEEQLRPPH